MFCKKKNIAILGSTGSIGKTSVKIIKKNISFFNVILLSCDKNFLEISKQIILLKPIYVIANNKIVYSKLVKKFSKKKIIFFNNFKDFKIKKKFDFTICSISGINGLASTFQFLKYSKKMLIANKESLVCGGNFLIKQSKIYNCKIVSIDSELYCLDIILKRNNLIDIKKIYITASGGPFFKKKNLKNIKISDALNHPTWKMGNKITIDSATLANKVLEMIEVVVLHSVPSDKIEIKVHPQSKLHVICLLKNGLVDFVGHNTDMSIPIHNSIFSNHLVKFDHINFLEKKKSTSLDISTPNKNQFPLVYLGYKILKLGNAAFILFNVINDHLVGLFLDKKIPFYKIIQNLITIFNNKEILLYCKKIKINNFNDIINVINYAEKICLEKKF